MSDDPTTGLRSVDPLATRTVNEDRLAESREALVRELAASDPDPADSAPGPARPKRSGLLRTGVILGIVGAVAVAILLTGNGSGSSDQTAYAAYSARAVKFAESTPLVLLEPPAWRVRYVDSSSNGAGEIDFRRSGADGSPIDAELGWHGGRLKKRRYAQVYRNSVISRNAPVLGTKALVYGMGFSRARKRAVIMARWRFDGRIMEMRAMVPDKGTFLAMLSSLRQVDAKTWLDAMPKSVIKAADTSAAVKKMLKGVPLPPGFDSSKINVPGLAQDRYQVGAIVVNTVVCSWFADWAKARSSGDKATENAAIKAMATARTWPVLRWMDKRGGYSKVVWGYAGHMRSGKFFGRPLAREVNAGLGCRDLGVK